LASVSQILWGIQVFCEYLWCMGFWLQGWLQFHNSSGNTVNTWVLTTWGKAK
jgi:hypothetical protein